MVIESKEETPMKSTSNYHGYQIKIHKLGASEELYNKGKIYKSREIAQNTLAKIVNGIDAGEISIKGFTHCEIIEWYA